MPRPDVAASLGVPGLARAGFRFAWRPSVALDGGGHTLYLYARSGRGEWAFLRRQFVFSAPPAAAMAIATAAFTERRLGVPVGGPDCERATAVGYRLSLDTPQWSDNWYDSSQLLADAALVSAGRDDALCRMRKGYRYLQYQWDTARPEGGFYARTYAEGGFHGGDKYADDNALAGLALIAAANATRDPEERRTFLLGAENVAKFLMQSGLWDDVFEGGFWWNTQKGGIDAGKTGQTNAVCAFFFLRLHREIPNPTYRDWGIRTLDWLDRIMWVPEQGGYRENIAHTDYAARTGVFRGPGLENYIQSIAAEAFMELYVQRLAPERDGLNRARALLRGLDQYWDTTLQNYTLPLGKPEVYTVYSAWLTPAYLRLAKLDPADPTWRRKARDNVAAIDARMRDDTGGGYYHRVIVENGQILYDRDKHTVAQAWMQYALAAITWPEAVVP